MKNIVIGNPAWSLVHGKGVIKSYDGETIVCQFDRVEASFTANGRMIEFRNHNQVLFFSPPKICALAVPEYTPRFKQNEQVIVSSHPTGAKGKCIQVGYENEHCVTTPDGKDYLKSEYYFFKVGQEVVMA